MRITYIPFFIIIGLVSTVTTVLSDEIIITHRSGKVQIIQIESSDDLIEQVSFRPAPQKASPVQSTILKPSPPSGEAHPDTGKTTDKAGPKIKWAPPADARY